MSLAPQPCIFDPEAHSSWIDKCDELTPWELRSGRWYKREDAFAPLGYGGPNGSKLRQLVHLVGRYVGSGGSGGLVTGASVLSPQLSMAALVARHFGLPCLIVLGGTKPETALRHPNVALAARYGASFAYAPVGYNTALQRSVARVAAAHPSWYHLHYGITTPPGASPLDVAAFHSVGAAQVRNIPPYVCDLIVPFGSANTAASVLTGLSLWTDHRVERVVLMAIGPDRQQWLSDRLAVVREGLNPAHWSTPRVLVTTLHGTWARYSDRMPASLDGIDFHPTYEGKIVRWLAAHPHAIPGFTDGDDLTGFWIVGSEARA